jgi:hypothetical protein
MQVIDLPQSGTKFFIVNFEPFPDALVKDLILIFEISLCEKFSEMYLRFDKNEKYYSVIFTHPDRKDILLHVNLPYHD